MAGIDHVIVAVADLEAAAARLAVEHGLGSVPGGVHPGYGTANRIVPVGARSYVELMAVHDRRVASAAPVGRFVQAAVAGSPAAGAPEAWVPAAWMVAADDIDGTAARLGADVEPGSRMLPDGSEVAWRLAGVATMLSEPPLPAFIGWEVAADRHPSAMRAGHDVAPAGIAWIELAGDEASLAAWLGPHRAGLDLRTVPGPPGVRAVGIALADGGEVVLR